MHKRILILSPQSWGKMYLSKHHYAIELAKKGNTVYFLNPPVVQKNVLHEPVRLVASGIDNLFIIEHRLSFPYNIKFHAIGIFHWLMGFHIKKILKTIKEPIDIVWSFDLGNLYPFRFFRKSPVKIFHPVDEPLNQTAIRSAKGAQIIFSVTREILEKYQGYDVPTHFINHGVSENFLRNDTAGQEGKSPVKIGFSGNLIRPDLDRDTLLHIIMQNPEVQFHCWGSYNMNQSNISGSDDKETVDFITRLQQQANVNLHGPVSSSRLAKEIHAMDGFIICYDVTKDQSKGTNYHKIMEYLSTGKVIVSNNVTTYKSQQVLLQMVESRSDNHQLPELFKQVISNLDQYNSPDKQDARIRFAKDNLYANQLNRIEAVLQKDVAGAVKRELHT